MFFRNKICRNGHLMDPSWKICPVCITPVVGWFVQIEDSRTINVYSIREGRNLIGKGADCDIRIMDEKGQKKNDIKRHHAIITTAFDQIIINGTGSGGRILVNRNEAALDIIDGDIISLGEVEFKFKCIY